MSDQTDVLQGTLALMVLKTLETLGITVHLEKDTKAVLGEGKVDLVSILDTMEASGHPANIMVELDRMPTW